MYPRNAREDMVPKALEPSRVVPSWLMWLMALSAIVGVGGFVVFVVSPGLSTAILAFGGLMALWYVLCRAEDTLVQCHS